MAQAAKSLAELEAFFDSLPAKLARNVLRGAMRASASVVANGIKEATNSHVIADAVRVTTGTKNGGVYAKVKVTGFAANLAIWGEFGTAAHLIFRRAPGSRSKTRTAADAKGSLKIGDEFVGPVIHHPGERANPVFFPTLDARQAEAVGAGRDYILTRMATIQGLETPDATEDQDEESIGEAA